MTQPTILFFKSSKIKTHDPSRNIKALSTKPDPKKEPRLHPIMSGIPLIVLQKWLGHASVFTTSIYTEITGIDTRGFMEMVK